MYLEPVFQKRHRLHPAVITGVGGVSHRATVNALPCFPNFATSRIHNTVKLDGVYEICTTQ